jgi:hypothetical protein
MKDYWLAEMLEEMEHKLPPAEQEFSNALISIAKKYGKLSNGDGNGIWVGYVEASGFKARWKPHNAVACRAADSLCK